MKRDAFDVLAEKVRNWGRWGPEDQRGALNHAGPEALKRAVASVTKGKTFALGMNFDKNGPQDGGFRINPMLYVTSNGLPLNPMFPYACYSDDVIHMSLQCATQWDALSHVHYDGELYNGCKACDVISVQGAAKCGVEHLAKPGVMSRGVLLDIARLKGVRRLSPDTAITPDDLNAACETQGVSVEPGDIVVIRTGHLSLFTHMNDRQSFNGLQPGMAVESAEWLHDKSAAAVAADNVAVERIDMGTMGGDMPLPFHMLALRDMGMPLGEMFEVEALADDCAEDGQYTFLLAAPPLAITGAFGSPINPMALK